MLKGILKLLLLNKLMGGAGRTGNNGRGCLQLFSLTILVLVLVVLVAVFRSCT